MIWPLKTKDAGSLIDVRIDTERLVLRPAQLSDYAQWAQVRGRNKDYLKPYEPRWPDNCLDRDFFERRVERLSRDWLGDHAYTFLIFENDVLTGGINLNNVSRGAAQFASLGYWLDEGAQGKGYMAEAAAGVIGYAFEQTGLQRVNAATLPHNQRSRNMLTRLGFTEEGFAKAYIQIDGVRADHVLYGLNAPMNIVA